MITPVEKRTRHVVGSKARTVQAQIRIAIFANYNVSIY